MYCSTLDATFHNTNLSNGRKKANACVIVILPKPTKTEFANKSLYLQYKVIRQLI